MTCPNRIWSGVEYALAVHEGTPPHEIKPKKKEGFVLGRS